MSVERLAWIAWITIAVGVALLAVTLRTMGSGITRHRYRRTVWHDRDTALAAVSLALLAFLATYRILDPLALIYYPFPRIHPPRFDPVVALALLCLAAPAVVGSWQLAAGSIEPRRHGAPLGYGDAEEERKE